MKNTFTIVASIVAVIFCGATIAQLYEVNRETHYNSYLLEQLVVPDPKPRDYQIEVARDSMTLYDLDHKLGTYKLGQDSISNAIINNNQ